MKRFLLLPFLLFSICSIVNAQLSVFSDSYGAGITFADFGGSINAVSIDNTVARSGTSSFKAVVPSSSYTGGTFKIATPQNLSAYNAVSFWVKADATKTLNVSGICDNSPITTYQAEYNSLPVSTTWTKYIIPIPAPSKLTAEEGLFHFAEGSDEGPYTLWFDDIQYENSPAIGAFSPAITTQTLTPLVGGTFTPTGQTLDVLVNGVSQTIKVKLACFDFMSSNTAVATITNGTGTAVGAGTAVITGTLKGVAATGTITVNVGAASVPMTAAPTPTRLASNVISVFSNAYTDVAGTDFFPNWGQSTTVTDIQIAGNATKKYSNLNYQGIVLGSAIDASAMEFVHFDVWTPTALTLDFFLISPGPVEKPFAASPATGAWVGYDVPLSAFNPPVALNNIFQMKLVGTPSSGTLYLDNIYFYKNPPSAVPLVAAPTPTRLASNVISVFSNAYTNVAGTDFNPNWGQTTAVTDVMIAGNDTKKYANLNYQGITLGSAINATAAGMEFVHFDVWTPAALTFDFFLISPGPVEKPFATSPAAGTWVGYDVPLSAFAPPVALNDIFQMKLVGTPSGGTVYLDNLYFYKNPAIPVPLVAAPTPTRLAANVISVFSNAYTNVAGTDFNPNWGQTTAVTDVTIAGNDTKKYANLNYQGITLGSAIDASAMEFVHFDVWTPSALTFDFFLISPGPQEKPFATSPATGAWVGYDVPLSHFAPPVALNDIFQMKLEGTPAGGTVYLDNIYFYKNPPSPVPLVAAPTPTRLASNVISVFSNAYTDVAGTDFFPNWGQTTAVTDVMIAGNATKKYTTLNYQGIALGSPINASAAGMEFVHFDIWTPAALTFQFSLISTGPQEKAFPTSPATGTWVGYDVPLSHFAPPVALNDIFQMKLEGTPAGGTVYLDNIYFYKNPPTVPLVAAPTPTRLASNVISVFSNAYTNVAGTDFFPNWGQTTVVTDVQIAGNDTKKYTTLNYQGIALGSPINATAAGMEFVHFDVWTPTALTFQFSLISTGPQEKAFPTSPATGTWVGYDVPLSAFAPPVALNDIFQMKLEGTPAGGTVYLDNIYFYKNPPTAPLAAAPTPTKPEANVISLFSDAYTNVTGTDWFPNWGQSTVVADISISGNTTKQYTNLNYQGVQFGSAINAAAMENLHLDLWTGNCTEFDVFLINTSPATVEQKVTLSPMAFGWNSFDIPLSSYNNIALNNIGQFKLEGRPSGCSLYLDNIYFHNTPALTVPTNLTIAAPPASTKTFDITTNTSWTATSDQTWLSITSPAPASGTGNATITLTAQANTSTSATRTATVTIAGPGITSKTITVVQDKAAVELSATPSNITIDAPANNLPSFQIKSNTAWTITSNQNWLSVDITSGIGNNPITLRAFANTATATRTATVTVSAVGAPDQIITVLQEGAVPDVSVSSNTLSIAAPANSKKTFEITSNTSWNITKDQNWLSLDQTTGANSTTVTLTADANPNTTTRTATITVLGANTPPVTVIVTQDAAAPSVAVPNNLTIGAAPNSTKVFDVTANTNWTVKSNQTWLTLSSPNGIKNAPLTLKAEANPNTTTRTAQVVISATGIADQTINVTQDAGAATLAVTTNTLSIAAPAGSEKKFKIISNATWTITSSETWLTPNTASGTADSTITLTAAANPNPAVRTATITVVAAGAVSQIITVTQDAAGTKLSVSSSDLTIAAPANSTKSFDITSNLSWTAVSSETWLVLDKASGTNNVTITLTAVQANPTTNTRTATITISAVGTGNQVVTVTQEGAAATLSVATNDITIAAPANTKTLTVTSNTSWTAFSNQTWLKLEKPNGSNIGDITLNADANLTVATRKATVTISANGITSQVVTVTQEAAAVKLTVSPTALTVTAPANSTVSFTIESNSNWSVSSTKTWLTPSSSGGFGPGKIILTADENPATTTRTASILVSAKGATDQIVTVTQEAGSAILTVSATALSIAAPIKSTNTFNITSNTNWTISSSETWLEPSSLSGADKATITLTTTQANPLKVVRTAIVTIKATGVVDKTIIVTQDFISAVNNIDNEKTAFSLYPNPVTENLFIKLLNPNNALYDLTINNLDGKMIMKLNNFDTQKSIDVAAFPEGVYIIQLMDNKTKGISTRKFVKL